MPGELSIRPLPRQRLERLCPMQCHLPNLQWGCQQPVPELLPRILSQLQFTVHYLQRGMRFVRCEQQLHKLHRRLFQSQRRLLGLRSNLLKVLRRFAEPVHHLREQILHVKRVVPALQRVMSQLRRHCDQLHVLSIKRNFEEQCMHQLVLDHRVSIVTALRPHRLCAM